MGRRAKPTALKVLAGNPGKRALPKGEPKPTGGLPKKPKMSKVAGAEWDRLAPMLDKIGLLTQIDLTAFVAYCECFADYRRAQKDIEKYGTVILMDGGLLKKNPAVQMRNDSLRLMRQFMVEFGITPSSRARVASQMTKDPKQMDLPGMPPPAEDPNKKMPVGPELSDELTDDNYFGLPN